MGQATLDRTFAVMGTTAQVRLTDGGPDLLDQAQERLASLELLWSRFLTNSEVSQLNRSPGIPVVVSAETFQLISQAIDAWTLTGGNFDPTVGASMAASGYDRPLATIDRSIAVDPSHYVAAPGPAEIVLHPYGSAVELPPGVQLDLGGIAKGAAADTVAAELVAAGASGCLVNIGGDISLVGTPPRPEGWQVLLDCPGSATSIAIGVRQGAICTSTKTKRTWGAPDTQRTWGAPDTQRTWGAPNSQPEHHLRRPDSGAPLETGVASVTIISSRAIQGEVLTKAVFAAGAARGMAIAEQADVTGLIVDDSGAVRMMAGLDPFLAAAVDCEPV